MDNQNLSKRLGEARRYVEHELTGSPRPEGRADAAKLPPYLIRYATADERGFTDRKPAGDFGDKPP
jgi:hypothetical protein